MKELIKKLSKANLIIIFLSLNLILIIIISEPFSKNWPVKQPSSAPPTREQPAATIAPVSIPPISLVLPKDYFLKPSTSFTVDVVPDKNMSASVYRIEVLFDANALEVEEVSAGDFFKDPQTLRKDIDNQQGRADFSFAISLEEKTTTDEPKNKNTLATITFKVKPLSTPEEISPTTIHFGEKTAIFSGEDKYDNLNQDLESITLETVHE